MEAAPAGPGPPKGFIIMLAAPPGPPIPGPAKLKGLPRPIAIGDGPLPKAPKFGRFIGGMGGIMGAEPRLAPPKEPKPGGLIIMKGFGPIPGPRPMLGPPGPIINGFGPPAPGKPGIPIPGPPGPKPNPPPPPRPNPGPPPLPVN